MPKLVTWSASTQGAFPMAVIYHDMPTKQPPQHASHEQPKLLGGLSKSGFCDSCDVWQHDAMVRADLDDPAVNTTRREPPWIERVRRIGWGLLLLALAIMVAARVGPDHWYYWSFAASLVIGPIGLLAIINVAMIRHIYRKLERQSNRPPDSVEP